MSFENLFFIILPGHILYMECPFGRLYGRTYYAQFSNKYGPTEAVFHFNSILNVPLKLKENCTLKYAYSRKIHSP